MTLLRDIRRKIKNSVIFPSVLFIHEAEEYRKEQMYHCWHRPFCCIWGNQKSISIDMSKDKGGFIYTDMDWFTFKRTLKKNTYSNSIVTVHPEKVFPSPGLHVPVKLWSAWNDSSVKMFCFHHPLPKHDIAKITQQQTGEMKMNEVWKICCASAGEDGQSHAVPFYQ